MGATKYTKRKKEEKGIPNYMELILSFDSQKANGGKKENFIYYYISSFVPIFSENPLLFKTINLPSLHLDIIYNIDEERMTIGQYYLVPVLRPIRINSTEFPSLFIVGMTIFSLQNDLYISFT